MKTLGVIVHSRFWVYRAWSVRLTDAKPRSESMYRYLDGPRWTLPRVEATRAA